MANTTINTHIPARQSGILSRLAALFVWLGETSDGARAARYAGRLAQMSDEELSKLGIKRDEIVAHAFRNLIWRG